MEWSINEINLQCKEDPRSLSRSPCSCEKKARRNWIGKASLNFSKPSVLFSLFCRRLRKNCEDLIYNDFFIPLFKYTNFICLLKLIYVQCDHIRNSRDPFIVPRPKYKIKSGPFLTEWTGSYTWCDIKKSLYLNCRLVLRVGKYCRAINSSTIYVSSKILPYTYGVADNKAVNFSRPSLQGWTWFTVSFSCHRCSFKCLVVLSIQWTDRYQNEQRACQEVNVHIKFSTLQKFFRVNIAGADMSNYEYNVISYE